CLAAMSADDGVEAQVGAIVTVGRRRANAPQRRRAPVLDYTAVELHLVEVRADIVVLEIAVDAADGVRLPPRQPALAHLLRERNQFPLQPLRLVVEGDRQLEEATIAVVALRVVARRRVVSEQ